MSSALTVLKIGGELLEDAAAVRMAAAAIGRLAAKCPLIVVHGGGRAIDAELRARGLEPRFVDGLRITDAAALDVVVSVLGRNNTALVAALNALGCRAVGLTGADAAIGLAELAPAYRSSANGPVDLGLVGVPRETSPTLLIDLVAAGYIPVVSTIGMTAEGDLLNMNADTFAAHLAGSLNAGRLIVAGSTAGVLDRSGVSIARLPLDRAAAMIRSGDAHSGMVAKLAACTAAMVKGVTTVSIVSGRDVTDFDSAPGTEIFRARAIA